jgi:hypothetical protein
MNDTSPQWERLATIVELTEKAPGELGRTALVKLCYFLQALRGVPLGYHFSLYAYGPFDAGVLDDLDYAQALDAVQSRLVNYATGYGYNIRPGTAAAEIKNKARDFLAGHQAAIDWVVQEFSGMSAAHLELASTAIFVDREAQRTREPLSLEELVRRVREVKPRFPEQQVRAIAELLRDKNLLRAIRS